MLLKAMEVVKEVGIAISVCVESGGGAVMSVAGVPEGNGEGEVISEVSCCVCNLISTCGNLVRDGEVSRVRGNIFCLPSCCPLLRGKAALLAASNAVPLVRV